MPVKTKIKNQISKIKTKAESSKRAKLNELTVDVYDTKGKVVEKMELPKEIFGLPLNKNLLSQAVRVYLANQRRGTVSTKTRGEVRGSTRKIYKQKGTGRARHGAVRAPIFVHGGIAFGPKPRDYSLNLSKKMKKKALFSALSEKLREGDIKIIAGLEKITPKTKKMFGVIKALKLDGGKMKLALIMPKKANDKDQIVNVQRAAKNIKGIELIFANQLNTFEVLRNKELLFMQEALGSIKSEV